MAMRKMAISRFKATCLSVVEDVRRTGVPVRITKRGKPVPDVVPIIAPGKKTCIGAMRGSMEIVGDIVGPIRAFGEWDDWGK